VLAGCTAGIPQPDTAADTGPTAGLEQGVSVTVVEVTDGDTMDVRVSDGSTETVRLLGVDTPEVHAENSPDEWEEIPATTTGSEWLSTWGQRASEFATERLAGETVEIRTDPEADRRGGYGRLLVYLSLPNTERSFNWQLLDRGYARLYDTPFSRRDAFAATEAQAQQSGAGVWGFSSGTTDRTATATQQSSLVLVEIHADAAGNDNENLDDEYLVFENSGSEPLDLSGARITDAAGHTYTVPEEVTVAAGAQLRLVTGSGDNSDTVLYWGEGGAIWNNDGDTVTVRDRDGELLLRESY
jgi:micrococcal nuclease